LRWRATFLRYRPSVVKTDTICGSSRKGQFNFSAGPEAYGARHSTFQATCRSEPRVAAISSSQILVVCNVLSKTSRPVALIEKPLIFSVSARFPILERVAQNIVPEAQSSYAWWRLLVRAALRAAAERPAEPFVLTAFRAAVERSEAVRRDAARFA
jgi:hypothetical protein